MATQTYDLTNTGIAGTISGPIAGQGTAAGRYIQIEGSVNPPSSGSPYWNTQVADCSIYFKATLASLAVYCYANYTQTFIVRLSIDGVDVAYAQLTATAGNWYWIGGTAAPWIWTGATTNFDSTAQHTYILSFGAHGLFPQQLQAFGGISIAQLPARPIIVCYGDSLTTDTMYGVVAEGNALDSTLGWVHLLGLLLANPTTAPDGFQTFNFGYSSMAVLTAGDTAGYLNKIKNLFAAPAIITCQWGCNDVDYEATSPTVYTAAACYAAYTDMLQKLHGFWPNALILAQRIMYEENVWHGDIHADQVLTTQSGALTAAAGTVTLTSGTWPSWIVAGMQITIGGQIYYLASGASGGTTATLTAANGGSTLTLATPTAYTLYEFTFTKDDYSSSIQNTSVPAVGSSNVVYAQGMFNAWDSPNINGSLYSYHLATQIHPDPNNTYNAAMRALAGSPAPWVAVPWTAWVPGSYSTLGQFVTHGGSTYVCTSANSDAAWTASHWSAVYPLTYYVVGEYVTYGGTSYVCTVANSDSVWNPAHWTPAATGVLADIDAYLSWGVATPVATGVTAPNEIAVTSSSVTGGIAPVSLQWYRSTAAGTLGSAVSGATAASLTDATVAPGTTYYYTLQATDANANVVSARSAGITTPAALNAGTISATATYDSIALQCSGASGGVPPYTYAWYRSLDGSLGTQVGSGQSFTDTRLSPHTFYFYTCVVSDAAGDSADTAQALIETLPIATTYSLAGPSTGAVGEASADFTLAPNAAFVGAVTPATDAYGAFSSTDPSWDGASLTWAGSTAAKTFTYTPTSTEASPHHVTCTNNAGLPNPGSLSYAVTGGLEPGSLSFANVAATSLAVDAGVTGGIGPYTYEFNRAPDEGGSPGEFTTVSTDQFNSAFYDYADNGLSPLTKYWYECVITDSEVPSSQVTVGPETVQTLIQLLQKNRPRAFCGLAFQGRDWLWLEGPAPVVWSRPRAFMGRVFNPRAWLWVNGASYVSENFFPEYYYYYQSLGA